MMPTNVQRERDAVRWQRERVAQLRAEIRIQQSLFRSLRTELAEMKNLSGKELLYRFGAQKLV